MLTKWLLLQNSQFWWKRSSFWPILFKLTCFLMHFITTSYCQEVYEHFFCHMSQCYVFIAVFYPQPSHHQCLPACQLPIHQGLNQTVLKVRFSLFLIYEIPLGWTKVMLIPVLDDRQVPPKLYIPSTINIWKKVLTKYVLNKIGI